MSSRNDKFTIRLLSALKERGVEYKPNTRGNLKKFAEDNEIVYTTLHKCLREENRGHVPEWDQLLKISIAVEKSVDWLLTGREETARSGTISPHKELLDKVDFVLIHGDRLSQITLEKAILELYQAMDKGRSSELEGEIRGRRYSTNKARINGRVIYVEF